jgi:hypothetical protein
MLALNLGSLMLPHFMILLTNPQRMSLPLQLHVIYLPPENVRGVNKELSTSNIVNGEGFQVKFLKLGVDSLSFLLQTSLTRWFVGVSHPLGTRVSFILFISHLTTSILITTKLLCLDILLTNHMMLFLTCFFSSGWREVTLELEPTLATYI